MAHSLADWLAVRARRAHGACSCAFSLAALNAPLRNRRCVLATHFLSAHGAPGVPPPPRASSALMRSLATPVVRCSAPAFALPPSSPPSCRALVPLPLPLPLPPLSPPRRYPARRRVSPRRSPRRAWYWPIATPSLPLLLLPHALLPTSAPPLPPVLAPCVWTMLSVSSKMPKAPELHPSWRTDAPPRGNAATPSRAPSLSGPSLPASSFKTGSTLKPFRTGCSTVRSRPDRSDFDNSPLLPGMKCCDWDPP